MPAANPARRPGATSGYVPVNGLDMYYEIHGDGSPLVLFHGAMGTIDSCFAKLHIGLLNRVALASIDDPRIPGHTCASTPVN